MTKEVPFRAFMLFHHILSGKKRADLKAWSKELKLETYIKVGYPGIVIAIGRESNVEEYVTRIKV